MDEPKGGRSMPPVVNRFSAAHMCQLATVMLGAVMTGLFGCMTIPLAAQVTTTYVVRVADDDVSCAGCKLEIEHTMTLTQQGDTAGIGGLHFSIALGSDGSFFLAGSGSTRPPVAWDSSGTVFTKFGVGGVPTPALPIKSIVARGDTLIVFHLNGTVREFDSRGQELSTHFIRIPPEHSIQLPRVGLVGVADIRTPDLVGYPIHLFGASYDHLGSVSDGQNELLPNSRRKTKFLTPRPLGGFVALDHLGGRVEVYSPDAELVDVLRFAQRWVAEAQKNTESAMFASHGPVPFEYRGAATPPPHFTAVYVDSGDRLWLLGAVEDPGWRALGVPMQGPGALPLNPSRWDRSWNSVLEVYDLHSGRLLNRTKLPFYASHILDGGLLVRPGEDGYHRLQIELWRAVISDATRHD